MNDQLCPLCGRVLGTVNIDRHHLIPRKFKGKDQYALHKICHRKIHSSFTERELLKSLHTWEALRATEEIRIFIEWVANKPPEFYRRTMTANAKKNR